MAPYEQRYLLYLTHFFYAFTSRMWDMGIVLFLAHVTNNNISIVALTGFLSTISVFLFMGKVGSYLDHTNRLSAAYLAVSIKVVAVSSAYLMGLILEEETEARPQLAYIIYIIPFLAAFASLAFSAITQSVEKDWIVVLSEKNSEWLTTTNSAMSQIDLVCASTAPAVAGFVFSTYSLPTTTMILLGTNGISAFAFIFLLKYLYHAYPALATREERPDKLPAISSKPSSKYSQYRAIPTVKSTELDEGTNPIDRYNSNISWEYRILQFLSLEEFADCGCAMVMVGYAFLYCTVLSFGSLMTVYLRFVGMTDMTIGIFRSANAFAGLLGATIFPYIASYMGLWNASQVAIVYQAVFVSIAAASFFFERGLAVAYVLATAVLLSRSGLWMFDLGVRQISQETIPEYYRGKVNGQWRSMTAGFEMGSYALAWWLPYGEDFWILSLISALMVFSALLTFSYAHKDHKDHLASLMDTPESNRIYERSI